MRSDGQTRATLCAPVADDPSACAGAHPEPKPVRLGPTPVVGLVGPLRHDFSRSSALVSAVCMATTSGQSGHLDRSAVTSTGRIGSLSDLEYPRLRCHRSNAPVVRRRPGSMLDRTGSQRSRKRSGSAQSAPVDPPDRT